MSKSKGSTFISFSQVISNDDSISFKSSNSNNNKTFKDSVINSNNQSFSPLYAGNNQLLVLLSKKLLKRDVITKTKALNELLILLNEENISDLVIYDLSDFLSFYLGIYNKILLENDGRLRLLFTQVLKRYLIILPRNNIKPFISIILSNLWVLMSDTISDIANEAKLTYETLFPNISKRNQNVSVYIKDIVLFIEKNLSFTVDNLNANNNIEEAQEKHERLMSTNIDSFSKLISAFGNDNDQYLSFYEVILIPSIWKKLINKNQFIRLSTYGLLSTVITKLPEYLENLYILQIKSTNCNDSKSVNPNIHPLNYLTITLVKSLKDENLNSNLQKLYQTLINYINTVNKRFPEFNWWNYISFSGDIIPLIKSYLWVYNKENDLHVLRVDSQSNQYKDIIINNLASLLNVWPTIRLNLNDIQNLFKDLNSHIISYIISTSSYNLDTYIKLVVSAFECCTIVFLRRIKYLDALVETGTDNILINQFQDILSIINQSFDTAVHLLFKVTSQTDIIINQTVGYISKLMYQLVISTKASNYISIDQWYDWLWNPLSKSIILLFQDKITYSNNTESSKIAGSTQCNVIIKIFKGIHELHNNNVSFDAIVIVYRRLLNECINLINISNQSLYQLLSISSINERTLIDLSLQLLLYHQFYLSIYIDSYVHYNLNYMTDSKVSDSISNWICRNHLKVICTVIERIKSYSITTHRKTIVDMLFKVLTTVIRLDKIIKCELPDLIVNYNDSYTTTLANCNDVFSYIFVQFISYESIECLSILLSNYKSNYININSINEIVEWVSIFISTSLNLKSTNRLTTNWEDSIKKSDKTLLVDIIFNICIIQNEFYEVLVQLLESKWMDCDYDIIAYSSNTLAFLLVIKCMYQSSYEIIKKLDNELVIQLLYLFYINRYSESLLTYWNEFKYNYFKSLPDEIRNVFIDRIINSFKLSNNFDGYKIDISSLTININDAIMLFQSIDQSSKLVFNFLNHINITNYDYIISILNGNDLIDYYLDCVYKLLTIQPAKQQILSIITSILNNRIVVLLLYISNLRRNKLLVATILAAIDELILHDKYQLIQYVLSLNLSTLLNDHYKDSINYNYLLIIIQLLSNSYTTDLSYSIDKSIYSKFFYQIPDKKLDKSTDIWYLIRPSQDSSIYSLAKASVIASHIEADIEPYYTIRLDANKEIQTDGYRLIILNPDYNLPTSVEVLNTDNSNSSNLLVDYITSQCNDISNCFKLLLNKSQVLISKVHSNAVVLSQVIRLLGKNPNYKMDKHMIRYLHNVVASLIVDLLNLSVKYSYSNQTIYSSVNSIIHHLSFEISVTLLDGLLDNLLNGSVDVNQIVFLSDVISLMTKPGSSISIYQSKSKSSNINRYIILRLIRSLTRFLSYYISDIVWYLIKNIMEIYLSNFVQNDIKFTSEDILQNIGLEVSAESELTILLDSLYILWINKPNNYTSKFTTNSWEVLGLTVCINLLLKSFESLKCELFENVCLTILSFMYLSNTAITGTPNKSKSIITTDTSPNCYTLLCLSFQFLHSLDGSKDESTDILNDSITIQLFDLLNKINSTYCKNILVKLLDILVKEACFILERPVVPSNENEADTNLEDDDQIEINAASEILEQLLGKYLFNKLNEIIGQVTATSVTKVYSKIEDFTSTSLDNASTLDSTFDDENDFDTEEVDFSSVSCVESTNELFLILCLHRIDILTSFISRDQIKVDNITIDEIYAYINRYFNKFSMNTYITNLITSIPHKYYNKSSNNLSVNHIWSMNYLLTNRSYDNDYISIYLLYQLIYIFPMIIRNYYLNNNQIKLNNYLNKFIVIYNIRYFIICKESNAVNKVNHNSISADLIIKCSLLQGEFVCEYLFDDIKFSIKLVYPINYPLSTISIEWVSKYKLPDIKYQYIQLNLHNNLLCNKPLINNIIVWKELLVNILNGLEPCPICYSIFHIKNKSKPNLQCNVCKNKFHSICLFTWFKSSGKNKCVLCQQTFFK